MQDARRALLGIEPSLCGFLHIGRRDRFDRGQIIINALPVAGHRIMPEEHGP